MILLTFTWEVIEMSMIGKKIQEAREMQNMTRQDLARKARIGVQTLENYETGAKIPEVQTVLKISTVLDIAPSDLLGTTYHAKHSVLDQEIDLLIGELGKENARQILQKAIDQKTFTS
jgi:transcriptional regulator with XRE-family HTH domain